MWTSALCISYLSVSLNRNNRYRNDRKDKIFLFCNISNRMQEFGSKFYKFLTWFKELFDSNQTEVSMSLEQIKRRGGGGNKENTILFKI